jgi:hypothetical protein
VGDARRVDDLRAFELDMRVAEVLEQPGAPAEQQRYEMDVDLVEQSGGEHLLGDVGAH